MEDRTSNKYLLTEIIDSRGRKMSCYLGSRQIYRVAQSAGKGGFDANNPLLH